MDEDPRTTGSPVGAERADDLASPQPASTDQGQAGEADRSPEEIRADIEQTREQVGDTVEALAEKTDVRGQAQQKIADLKASAQRKREELTAKAKSTTPDSAQQSGQQVVAKVRENPAPAALAGAVLAGFLLGRLTGRRS
jgi:thioredoxin-like negative regulator of GroEL